MMTSLIPVRWSMLAARGWSLVLVVGVMAHTAAQAPSIRPARLGRDYFKSGDGTLRAFTPVVARARHSVVKLDLDGNTVALAAVVEANGLALTKASEMKPGKLTAWLPSGKEVPAELLATDIESDVALVKIDATGLKPVSWVSEAMTVGQWVVTPGTAETPQAAGIVSVAPRKIHHKRAFIGVHLDFKSPVARIAELMPGLGAEKAGLKSGDVILAVNDALVPKSDDLMTMLREFREGQAVKLRVRRDQEEFEASIEMITPKSDGGRGFNRAERMDRFGSELSARAEGFALAIQHDTVLQAWQCGGPLLNLDGKAIGLNIARAGRVASYALPAEIVKPLITQLKERASKAGSDKAASETSQPSTPQSAQ